MGAFRDSRFTTPTKLTTSRGWLYAVTLRLV